MPLTRVIGAQVDTGLHRRGIGGVWPKSCAAGIADDAAIDLAHHAYPALAVELVEPGCALFECERFQVERDVTCHDIVVVDVQQRLVMTRRGASRRDRPWSSGSPGKQSDLTVSHGLCVQVRPAGNVQILSRGATTTQGLWGTPKGDL